MPMNIKCGITQYKTLDNDLMAIIDHIDENPGGIHTVNIVDRHGNIIADYISFKKMGQI